MNILYLINYAGKAGTEKYVRTLVSAFNRRTVEGEGCRCFFAYNIEGPLTAWMRDNDIPTLKLDMRRPFDFTAARKLAKYCSDNRIDVIHAQYARENYVAVLARLFCRNLRVVYTYHLIEPIPTLWRICNRFMTKGDSRVIAVCEMTRQRLVEGGVSDGRIMVVPNGAVPRTPVEQQSFAAMRQSARASLGISPDVCVFTIMSRYSPEKGLETLVDAALCLRDRTDKPFQVLILGDGDGYDSLTARIEHYELKGVVRQLGFCSETDTILAASDVYLNTSDYEAVSFSILEAMNSSLPLILTGVGGNPDLCGRKENACGILVPAGDSNALASAMEEMQNSPQKRAAFGKKASMRVRERFNLASSLALTFDAYRHP